ncbi:MAG: hypothetical protein MJ189_03715 [Coriobacteriales bacterium]|nr:hypothetical protein [Coriobacteriales bacterium]
MGFFTKKVVCSKCGNAFRAARIGIVKPVDGDICYDCLKQANAYGLTKTRKWNKKGGKFSIERKKDLTVQDFIEFDQVIADSNTAFQQFHETSRSKGSDAWVAADTAHGLFYVENPTDECERSMVFRIDQITGFREVHDMYIRNHLPKFVGGCVCIELANSPVEWLGLYPCGGEDPEWAMSREGVANNNRPVIEFLEELTGMVALEPVEEDKGIAAYAG